MSPTLPSSLPPRGEGMHQPGFTYFCLWCPGSEGALSPREAFPLPAAPLLVAFTFLRGAATKFPESERGQAALGSSLEG